MKKTVLLSFIATTLLIVSCNTKTEVKNDLMLADSLLIAADKIYNSNDPQQMANLYAEDALLVANGTNIWSRDSIYALFKSMPSLMIVNDSYKSYMGPTTITSTLVQMQKYYTAELVMGSTKLKAKGTGFLTWGKQTDGTWKITMFVEFGDMKPF